MIELSVVDLIKGFMILITSIAYVIGILKESKCKKS